MKFTANNFTTALPEGWDDRTMITLLAPYEPGSFAANVVIIRSALETGATLEEFAAGQLQLLQTSLPNFALLDQRLAKVGDYPAHQQLHRFEAETGVLQQVQTLLLADSQIFAITGTATVEEFDRHIQAFREVVENFRAD